MLYHYLVKFRSYTPGDDFTVFVKVGTSCPINENVIKQLFPGSKENLVLSVYILICFGTHLLHHL